MNKANATNIAKTKVNGFEWYVPHYAASITQQTILSKQTSGKTPTELQYAERSFPIKEVNTRNFRTLDIGTQEGINVLIWIFVDFQQRDKENSQNLNNDSFYRPPVTSAHCVIGTEKIPRLWHINNL